MKPREGENREAETIQRAWLPGTTPRGQLSNPVLGSPAVIPAKAGIHLGMVFGERRLFFVLDEKKRWTPACAGVTPKSQRDFGQSALHFAQLDSYKPREKENREAEAIQKAWPGEGYVHDSQNQLAGYRMLSGSVVVRQARYLYDGLGRRMAKAVDADGAGPAPPRSDAKRCDRRKAARLFW